MAASVAASKLLNLRNPVLQNLIRRQILCPSATVASSSVSPLQSTSTSPSLQDAQSLNDLPHRLSNMRNLDILVPNFPLNYQWLRGSYVMQIEAAGKHVDDDSEDDYEDDDDDEFDDYIESDFDEEENEYDDLDAEPAASHPSRSYRR